MTTSTAEARRCEHCENAIETEAVWVTIDGPPQLTLASRLCPHCCDLTQRRLSDLEGLGHRSWFWTFDTFPAENHAARRALAQARRYLASPRTNEYDAETGGYWDEANLYIYGPVGAGKTGLAYSLIRHAIEEEAIDARFRSVRRLLFEARQRFSNGSLEEDPIWALRDVALLALDDLGAERVTDWTRDALANLIEYRYDHVGPLIVTSNYSPAQLARRLGHDDPVIGQRIVSRLVDGAAKIKLERADLRARREAA